MNVLAIHDPVGKTLHQVFMDLRAFGLCWGIQGASVFVKDADDAPDAPGKKAAEDMNLGAILKAHAELRQATVVSWNDFLGMTVFRVVLPQEGTDGDPCPEAQGATA